MVATSDNFSATSGKITRADIELLDDVSEKGHTTLERLRALQDEAADLWTTLDEGACRAKLEIVLSDIGKTINEHLTTETY